MSKRRNPVTEDDKSAPRPAKRSVGRPRLVASRHPQLGPEGEILLAASRLLSVQGYAGTSTRQIAEAAGLQQASLYHYFPTKPAIFNALLTELSAPIIAVAQALAVEDAADDVRLHALFQADCRHVSLLPASLGTVVRLPEARTEIAAKWREQFATVLRLYAKLAAACAARQGVEGVLPVAAPHRMAGLLVGMRIDGFEEQVAPVEFADACFRFCGFRSLNARNRARATALADQLWSAQTPAPWVVAAQP
ncbi:TetR family transcriptional regulator [Epidermidibacterium keratini]|uniref:TetR family transcriptional regulator n=1 Tax=Epidermidibacterium keratini TaxID=1891644 RepID=A0A7L4YQ49_9ACTN|nr:TetR/AcrR family transcriptional regulator [Epidermidibacterium keratini]QHC00919.1 TetR family transcriptional regulator [Epidermidibacterium keratini]